MARADRTVPFYIATERRPLTTAERELVRALAEREAPQHLGALDELAVVGRCGCGRCPTVFFKPYDASATERQVASYAGRDTSNGLTGVVLWQEGGKLSQLEFYSVDGHDPWMPPSVMTLERL